MKKYTVGAILLAVILTVSVTAFVHAYKSSALKVIHSRKSVRHFTGQKVTPQEIETLLRAGMAAPSASNCQPWSFIVVTDRSALDTIRDGLVYGKMLNQVDTAIVVCAVPARASRQKTGFAVIDSTCAGQNILLAAQAMGLGAVWLAGYPMEENMEVLRNTLGIPEDIIPLTIIPIGHPTGEDRPQDKFKPENIHWGKW